MASLDFDATAQPTDVIAALSLARGRSYEGQNVSTTATLYLRDVAVGGAVPEPTSRAKRVEASGTFTIRPDGDPTYLWTDAPGGCPVIFTELG